MATHWLSFRLEDNRTYSQRYDMLVETVRRQSSRWWIETSSFFVFESERGIDSITSTVKSAIDPNVDLVLIGMTDFKSARLIGNNQDNDIFDLIPFVKKV